VLDVPSLSLKTGISHRFLRPSQAIVDPSLTSSLPSEVVAAAGLDVVCHAAESYLSLPYSSRPAPASPSERPPYQGANPVADVWSAKALEYGGSYLRRAVEGDVEARGWMMLAASMAGVGFGSAGVHIPHACAYPIAGLRHSYVPPGYPSDHGFVPHGISVIVTAPAAFRFTYPASPSRHEHVAALLGAPGSGPDALPLALLSLMADLGVPSLSDLGYDSDDIPALVSGARAQERLLVGSPREVTDDDLSAILRESLRT
jgi:alcohol dehydrogenase class IV